MSSSTTINTPEAIETFTRRMHRAGYVVAGVYFTQEVVIGFGPLNEAQMIALFRSIVMGFDAKQVPLVVTEETK